MYLPTDHCGVREVREEYTCQRMVVKTGRGFCMLTSTQVSMRFTWIQKILRFYMPLHIRGEGTSIHMLEVVQVQVYTNLRILENHGRKLIKDYQELKLGELVWIFHQLIIMCFMQLSKRLIGREGFINLKIWESRGQNKVVK